MNLASRIPPKFRTVVYVILAIASAVQASFAVLPADTWGRVVSCLTMLGFTVAAGNVPKRN